MLDKIKLYFINETASISIDGQKQGTVSPLYSKASKDEADVSLESRKRSRGEEGLFMGSEIPTPRSQHLNLLS